DAGLLGRLDLRQFSERDLAAIADVAPAIPLAEAASFLMKYLENRKVNEKSAVAIFRHIARYAPEGQADEVIALARRNTAADLGVELATLKAIQEGLSQRGKALADSGRGWGQTLATTLLEQSAGSKRIRTARQQGAAEIAQSLGLAQLEPQLIALLANKTAEPPARAAAAKALASLKVASYVPALSKIVADSSENPAVRERAAVALVESNAAAGRQGVADALATAPQTLQTR